MKVKKSRNSKNSDDRKTITKLNVISPHLAICSFSVAFSLLVRDIGIRQLDQNLNKIAKFKENSNHIRFMFDVIESYYWFRCAEIRLKAFAFIFWILFLSSMAKKLCSSEHNWYAFQVDIYFYRDCTHSRPFYCQITSCFELVWACLYGKKHTHTCLN